MLALRFNDSLSQNLSRKEMQKSSNFFAVIDEASNFVPGTTDG